MKQVLLTAVAVTALLAAGLCVKASADPLDGNHPLVAMMGNGGGMMGGQGYGGMGGQGYGGMGGAGVGRGYDGDRGDGWQGYGNGRYGDDNHDRQALRDELHRQRRELSGMIRSGHAGQEDLDRKMDRIEGLERQLDSGR